MCYQGVTRGGGGNGYRNESAQKVDPGEENSPGAPAGTRTQRHESGALTTELSPLPSQVWKLALGECGRDVLYGPLTLTWAGNVSACRQTAVVHG